MARALAKLVLSLGMMVLGGCVVGPKYVSPSAPAVPAYKELGAPNVIEGAWKRAEPGDQAARGKWWETFSDVDLNQLEEKVNSSNQNIVAAAANVQAARAMIREARSQYFPTLTANPAITNTRLSNGFGQTFSANFSRTFGAGSEIQSRRVRSPHKPARPTSKTFAYPRRRISQLITMSCARRIR